MEIILLFGAGLIAGAINSLAGGGSFIAFPALLLAGVPVVVANATNTFAAWPGYVSGAIGFWPHIKQHRALLLPYTIAGLLRGQIETLKKPNVHAVRKCLGARGWSM